MHVCSPNGPYRKIKVGPAYEQDPKTVNPSTLIEFLIDARSVIVGAKHRINILMECCDDWMVFKDMLKPKGKGYGKGD